MKRVLGMGWELCLGHCWKGGVPRRSLAAPCCGPAPSSCGPGGQKVASPRRCLQGRALALSNPFCNPAGCVDEMQQCKAWARLGFCARRPAFMKRHCPKICNSCFGEVPPPHSHAVARPTAASSPQSPSWGSSPCPAPPRQGKVLLAPPHVPLMLPLPGLRRPSHGDRGLAGGGCEAPQLLVSLLCASLCLPEAPAAAPTPPARPPHARYISEGRVITFHCGLNSSRPHLHVR